MRVIPILLYHRLADNPDLEDHLDYLQSQGYQTAHLADVWHYLTAPQSVAFPAGKVVLTFDDAQQDFFDNVRPFLQRYGFTATVCVPTGFVSESPRSRSINDWNHGPAEPMMTWDELQMLVDEGFELISHSVEHQALHDFAEDPARLRREIIGSKQALESRLSISVDAFSLPYGGGWGNPDIKQALEQAGYKSALMAWYESAASRVFPTYFIPRWPVSGSTIATVLDEIENLDE